MGPLALLLARLPESKQAPMMDIDEAADDVLSMTLSDREPVSTSQLQDQPVLAECMAELPGGHAQHTQIFYRGGFSHRGGTV